MIKDSGERTEFDTGAELSIWEGFKCLSHIKIKYCPMCGRKLVKE